MYYLESDSIANSQPTRTDEIEKLDNILYLNQGDFVRLVRLAALLDLDEDEVDGLLSLYEADGVVTRKDVVICPECDAIIENVGQSIECDLCEKTFTNEYEVEVAFVPRHTVFEAGDELAAPRNSSDHIDGVYRVIGCGNEDRVLDVVFLHGLDGDATTTWHPSGKPKDYWPRWLGEDIPGVGVWSVEYEAKKFKWTGSALPLVDRATSLRNKLVLSGIGQRPFVLITHSLGGLVAKQMLRNSHDGDDAAWREFGEQCQAIVFLATPHAGSDLSGYAKTLGAILRPTIATKDLEAHGPHLRDLNKWYRSKVDKLGIETLVFFETRKTSGFTVVDATSADPGITGVEPIPVESDHIVICKLSSRGHEVYVACKQLIERVLAAI